MTTEQKILKAFELSLKIGGLTFSHHPVSTEVHAYNFKDDVSGYCLSFKGYYSEWAHDSLDSVDSMISKMEDYIKENKL